jgi:chromosome segregation ATPase
MELDGFKQDVEQKLRMGIDGVPPVLATALARFRRDVVESLEERLATMELNLRNLDRMRRSSRPEFSEEEETTGRYRGLSSTLAQEQGERRALQGTLSEHMKDEAQRWMTLERTLGRFEGLIGIWENDRKGIEAQIQTLRQELQSWTRNQ